MCSATGGTRIVTHPKIPVVVFATNTALMVWLAAVLATDDLRLSVALAGAVLPLLLTLEVIVNAGDYRPSEDSS